MKCLLNVGETLENYLKPVNTADEKTYGHSSKSNQMCLEDEQALRHFLRAYVS